MPRTLPKHGTEQGYKAELAVGKPCDRCTKAHRVYNWQFTKRYKEQGIKYKTTQTLDHLADQRNAETFRADIGSTRVSQGQDSTRTVGEPIRDSTRLESDSPEVSSSESLRERLTSAIHTLHVPEQQNPYVEADEIPEYLSDAARDVPKDAEPDGDWSRVTPEDEIFVITGKDMALIEENMGTYMSVLGMTLEIVDPYCGPIFGDSLENMVKRWSKVVARYPKAANLFLAKGGGTIMDWIAALQSTWPVLFAVYEHHLAGTVKTDGRTVYRVSPTNNGHRPDFDATTPPGPDYSEYPAR